MPSGSGYCRSTWACLADSPRSASHTPDRTASHRTRGTRKDPAFFRCLPYCSPVRKNARGLKNKGLPGMKKAVADLAPTLPVKVISFSNKPAFYADFSHDMYVSGNAAQRPPTPGYQFCENQRKRGRRSPVPLVFRIMTSPTFSVPIRRIAVLSSGLLIVAPLTQCLPVRSVPEELRVSSVRNDVIHNRRRRCDAMSQALLTKRVEL